MWARGGAAMFPSAWSGAEHCSSEPPSWWLRRSGVAGRPSVGDIDTCGGSAQGSPRTSVGEVEACGRPAQRSPRGAGANRASGPARVGNATKWRLAAPSDPDPTLGSAHAHDLRGARPRWHHLGHDQPAHPYGRGGGSQPTPAGRAVPAGIAHPDVDPGLGGGRPD